MVHTLIKLLSIKLSNINHAREKIIITINVINKLKFFHLDIRNILVKTISVCNESLN